MRGRGRKRSTEVVGGKRRGIDTAYKPIAPVDQNDLEIFVPAGNDMFIDIKFYIVGKLVSASE